MAQNSGGKSVEYLNVASLTGSSAEAFQKQHPYPWLKIENTLSDEGFRKLCENMPDIAIFNREEGVKRAYGQGSHNRFSLHYKPGMQLPKPWMDFLEELQSDDYAKFLRRMLGGKGSLLTFEWHYAWQGCSVSPHCDASRKIATHLFYFNQENWQPEWGGQTLVLEDVDGKFPTHSAPKFEELKEVASSSPAGNNSMIFGRTPNSWHGVRALNCPEGTMRRLFKVTANAMNFQVLWRKVRGKDPDGFRVRA
jgi:hypothetical protein